MSESSKFAYLLYYLAMIFVVFGNILGNFFLKKGGVSIEENYPFFRFLNIYFLFGISSFAMSIIIYTLVLRVIPLYQAQALASLQFIGSVFVGHYFFFEKITSIQFTGIGMIFFGIILVLVRG